VQFCDRANSYFVVVEIFCGESAIDSNVGRGSRTGYSSPDVLYVFTLSSAPLTISTCSSVTNFQTVLRLFSDFALTNQLFFNYNFCGNGKSQISSTNLGSGTYYLLVEGFLFSSEVGIYELTLTCSGLLLLKLFFLC
jgi:hypothetical protein